jgi:hypothetical protein
LAIKWRQMKRELLLVGLAAAALCGCVERGGKSTSTAPPFHLHWVGAANLTNTSTPTNLQQALALPATSALRDEVFGKLARTPQELWKKSLPANAADASSLLRPLLNDLWNSESFVEVRGDAARPDLVVGVQVDDKRAALWSTNLWQTANSWKLGAPAANANSKGWSAGKREGLHYARSGKWVLAAFTHTGRNSLEAMLKADRPVPALDPAMVDFKADFLRLKDVFSFLGNYPLPPIELKVTPKGQSLRTEATLKYSDRLPIKIEGWRIPTNLISEPLISFTCGQGIAPLWNQFRGFSALRLKNPPNQFTMWGLGTVHVQTFFTVPMPNATNVAKDLAPRLPELVKAYFPDTPGNFLWISNRAEWIWGRLPMIAPHVRPERTPAGEFLFAGLFPMAPRTNSAPAELFSQVASRTNLVYYDWELSQERLPHARHTFQLLDIISGRQLSPAGSASQQWLTNLPPYLGNTITEVILTSPKELSLVRKSDLGLTGFELALLARWFDSPGFPMRYQAPPARTVSTNHSAASVTNRVISPATNRPPAARTNSGSPPKQ